MIVRTLSKTVVFTKPFLLKGVDPILPADAPAARRGRAQAMPDYRFKQTAEIQITCPRCGYCMIRTVARLRRETKILCPSCGGTVAPRADQLDGREPSTRDDK